MMAKVVSYIEHQRTVFASTEYGSTHTETETLLSAYDAYQCVRGRALAAGSPERASQAGR